MKAPKGSYERYFGQYGRGQLPVDKIDALMSEGKTKAEAEVGAKRARQQAWWRIVHRFAGARTAPGRRATPGYVLGVDDRLSSLAQHIVTGMSTEAKAEIFTADKLPENYRTHVKGTPTEVAERVVYEMILRELIELRDQYDLYFLDGEWRIVPSALTEYYQLVRKTIPDPVGRGDYRRGSSGPRISRRLPQAVRRELLAAT